MILGKVGNGGYCSLGVFGEGVGWGRWWIGINLRGFECLESEYWSERRLGLVFYKCGVDVLGFYIYMGVHSI